MPAAIPQAIQGLYVGLCRDPDKRSWPVRKLHEEAVRLIRRRDPKAQVPSEQWAYTFVRRLRARLLDQPTLEEGWSLGSLETSGLEFHADSIPDLLEVSRHARVCGIPFTNRQAKWVARLRTMVPSIPIGSWRPFWLYQAGSIYANEEIVANVLGRDLDTGGRDLMLSIGQPPNLPMEFESIEKLDAKTLFGQLAATSGMFPRPIAEEAEDEKGLYEQLYSFRIFPSALAESFRRFDRARPEEPLSQLVIVLNPLALDIVILVMTLIVERSATWSAMNERQQREYAKILIDLANGEQWPEVAKHYGGLADDNRQRD